MDIDEAVKDQEGETEEHRDRYRELLEETRTIMPGTQVLFAFLLTAAFTDRFEDLDGLAKGSYAAALLLAGLATVLLMGPAAFHRMSEPGNRGERLLVSIRLQVVGMALLLAAVTMVTFVVIRLAFDDTALGLVFAAVVALTGIAVWYVLPRAKHLDTPD